MVNHAFTKLKEINYVSNAKREVLSLKTNLKMIYPHFQVSLVRAKWKNEAVMLKIHKPFNVLV